MVLIIEDDEIIRRLYVAILTRRGFAALEAEDAQSGIDLAKAQQPDVILMDIQMPGMDGIQATTIIHQQPGLETLPVIVLTGHVTDEHLRRAREAGCADFLAKPITSSQLVEAITRALNEAGKPPAI
jgi:two-component system cell cycle response regulator DivK